MEDCFKDGEKVLRGNLRHDNRVLDILTDSFVRMMQ